MIETVRAESGDNVLRFQGRLLASRFDPRREASKWVLTRGRFIDKVQTVFVLGLGSGYHISELLKATSAKIIVLEASTDIIEAVAPEGDLANKRVSIHHVSSAKSLRRLDAVKSAVKKSFVVLAHPPSRSLFSELYSDIQSQLVARDWGSLNWQWKMRGGPDFNKTARIDGEEQPLTIFDLEQTELVKNSEERERMLFKALRELVK